MNIVRKFFLIFRVAFFWVLFLCAFANVAGQSLEEVREIKKKGRLMNMTQPDSALMYHEKALESYATLGDSLRMLKTQVDIARIHSSSGNYHLAYDMYWEALKLAELDMSVKAEIHIGLATLYSIFGRTKNTESNIYQALSIKKDLLQQGQIEKKDLTGAYTMMTNHQLSLGNIQLAQNFLDTAYLVNNSQKGELDNPYLNVLQGRIYYIEDRFEIAEEYLRKAAQALPQPEIAYHTIVYFYLGDVYCALGDFKKGEQYYLKSIALSDTYKKFQNNASKVYQRIVELYEQQGRLAEAYHYQKEGTELEKRLFDARSQDKVSMLEIKDEYRLALDKKEAQLKKARLDELEQQQQILFLRNSVLLVSVVALLALALFIFFYLQNKRKAEAKFHTNSQKMSREKNAEILELKNKELTASALKMIEKDELLLEVKEVIEEFKESGNKRPLDSVLNKIKINSKQDWKEFDARFTSVNQDFYAKLSEIYPELTPRDHKLCALIKLNFSSKEIAQLIGISMESVNTSRYRLRKKMKLDKADNLVDIIGRM